MTHYVIAAMYQFVRLDHFRTLQKPLLKVMQQQQIKGTLLLAREGINGTVAGTRDAIDALYAWLKQYPEFKQIQSKESFNEKMPFLRSKVKLKKEIVTMGVENIDPNHSVGTYVKPTEWNALISSPDVTVIDTRNDYEVQIGTFKHAINPNTNSFREFPDYAKQQLNPEKQKKVAMFCTGGIRCEKSTAYLKQLGFDEVYHLEGGILKYLEEVPPEESLWEGECFVFDDRVAVNHHLQKGHYDQCHACRRPITEEQKQSEFYEAGVSCPYCFDALTDEQKKRFAERQRQSELAQQRGEPHIGSEVQSVIDKRRQQKYDKRERQRNQQG
ncbi:rhodanese-related sulfurtransferase [Legionella sp. W05-934-2]|jgi:UPF0176 protein|uniref:oxygen-dependent tRNA uridine(34) hydroxylase TrhO n=1 Tax=Legionella sp. W05-934-2 TaxID=1198649 RepID=UPI0034624255